jgi:predicted RND superfamily exporter protein
MRRDYKNRLVSILRLLVGFSSKLVSKLKILKSFGLVIKSGKMEKSR